MKIVIGNDHVAVEMKQDLTKYLEEKGHEVINVGTDESASFHYPISAYRACKKIQDGEADCGILICGTGEGIGISANKMKGIRCCICSDPYTAKLSKQHNNANVIAFGARVIGPELARMIVDEWLNAEFMGGRHQLRVDMIMELEATGRLSGIED